jgi:hypothetical protein
MIKSDMYKTRKGNKFAHKYFIMKTKIYKSIFVAFLITLKISSVAQPVSQLPYFNDFEDTLQNASWLEFQQGELNHHWAFINSNDIYNSTRCLASNGYWWDCNPPAVINWITSTPIDFTSGCCMSLSAKISENGSLGEITQLGYGHQIKAFVLVGSDNPDSACMIFEIANLTDLFSGNDYGGSSIWKDTCNIFIPPTQGPTYLSFKYTGGNPFHVKIDNLNISKDMTVTALQEEFENNAIHIFPNPSIGTIQFSNLPDGKFFSFIIYSLSGEQVFLQKRINSEKIRTGLPLGLYTYALKDENHSIWKCGKLIITNAL